MKEVQQSLTPLVPAIGGQHLSELYGVTAIQPERRNFALRDQVAKFAENYGK